MTKQAFVLHAAGSCVLCAIMKEKRIQPSTWGPAEGTPITALLIKNIKEKLAGYCENCDRNAFNAKEENWPKPGIGNWIAMAVSVALALGGAAITVNQFKQVAEMNTSLTPKVYYVVVDTPEGSFGRDINGLYQE